MKKLGDVIKRVPVLKPHDKKLLDAGAAIRERPPEHGDRAYLTSLLVQCTLPHSKPKTDVWVRRDGLNSLIVQSGVDDDGKPSGLPYGTVPRLLLFWLCTEIKAEYARAEREGREPSRRIELGHSMEDFMHRVGLNPSTGGGKRGDAKRLHEQADKLFNSHFTFHRRDDEAGPPERARYAVVDKDFLFWDKKDPEQRLLFGSWIEPSRGFAEAIVRNPVPVNFVALRALKKSPLALDLYALCTYEAFRARRSGKARFTTWAQLMNQLGGNYKADDVNSFRAAVKAALRKIRVVYPGLAVGKRTGGLEVLPSSVTAIPVAPMTIDL